MHYNLVKASNRRYLEELNNKVHEMPVVYDSVNIIQETEWVINKPVYDLIKTCMDNDFNLGQLPVNPQSTELPPKPFDIKTNKEALIKWKREAQQVHKAIGQSMSKFIQVRLIMEEASMLLDKGGFFYPHQFDFRFRIYPKPALLSPQSADYSRALLKFKFGKRMGKGDSVSTFNIAGANLYGEVDKMELPVREQWVQDNSKKIIASANNPLENTWWCDADKPYCFLAWAIEYRDFAESNYSPEFITTLPIQADCSNSGLQHYSAMMRDPIGGKATNLVPSNKPNDVYNLVAQKLIMKLRDIKDDPLAKKWLEYGIDRKLCKKPVMCLPYSLTKFSCRKYIEDHMKKQLNERNVSIDIFKVSDREDGIFEATNWLTPVLWESINEIIVGAKEIMKFLKDIAKLVASENLPVSWTSPLNAPIQMLCYEKESRRVKTQMGDSIVKLSVAHDTPNISKRATSLGICPNFIHANDGAVLQLAVVKAKELGVDNFSMIHDSFGCVASDSHLMGKALREAFCEIYQKDVLKNFADEMYAMLSEKNQKKFPKMPKKGDLNLDLVKQSVFFCI
nr:DNA-directed RNA polymerase [uncultured Mediterranean phage uvMED]